jgi:hypothetical protein
MQQRSLIILLVAGALVLAGLAGAVAVYWNWAAGQLVTGVERWRGAQESRGYAIHYQGPDLDGFPTALQARFSGPRIEAPGAWRWTGPEIAGEAGLLTPLNIRLDFPGAHRFEALLGEESITFDLAAAVAAAQIWLGGDGRLEAAETELKYLHVTGSPLIALERLWTRVEARFLPGDGDGGGQPAFDLAVEARAVELPAGTGGALGDRIEGLDLETTLVGDIPAGATKAALGIWRDAGGNLRIHASELTWGPLVIEAEGNLTLDGKLRPKGRLQARVRGLTELADILVERGAIDAEAAAGIKIMAAVLGGQNGGPGAKLPITLRRGRLYLGPAKVLRFGPIL